jgi:hypothetical protein
MTLCLKIIKSQPLTYTVLAAGIAFVGFSQTTHAGFEWIPPSPAAKVAPAQPAPAAQDGMMAPAESEPMTDDAFLPVPGDAPAAEPLAQEDMNAAPVAAAPQDGMQNDMDAPMPITSRPQMKTLNVGEAAPEAAQAEHAMKVKTMDAPAEADPMMMPMEEPVVQEAVVPADTPEEVRQAVQKNTGKSLSVDPYPTMKPAKSKSAVQAPFSEATVEDQDVVGFGTDIPLALALQQVAPAGYAFSFGESINPGAKVSWSGGDNWVTVMRKMIEPLGLQADIHGRVIFVGHERQSAAEPATLPASEEPSEAYAAPELIAPAAGDAQDEPEDNIRRVSVNDPGSTEQAQPKKTIKVLSERQPVATTPAPEAGDKHVVWEARKGDSLKETLESWSKTGGFDVTWSAMHDYTLESDVLVAGEISTALKSLINDGMSKEEAPEIIFKRNGETADKATLIVKERV